MIWQQYYALCTLQNNYVFMFKIFQCFFSTYSRMNENYCIPLFGFISFIQDDNNYFENSWQSIMKKLILSRYKDCKTVTQKIVHKRVTYIQHCSWKPVQREPGTQSWFLRCVSEASTRVNCSRPGKSCLTLDPVGLLMHRKPQLSSWPPDTCTRTWAISCSIMTGDQY